MIQIIKHPNCLTTAENSDLDLVTLSCDSYRLSGCLQRSGESVTAILKIDGCLKRQQEKSWSQTGAHYNI